MEPGKAALKKATTYEDLERKEIVGILDRAIGPEAVANALSEGGVEKVIDRVKEAKSRVLTLLEETGGSRGEINES